MSRQPRYPLIGVPQHIIQRGNNRQATFFDKADYDYYRYCLADSLDKCDCQLHAYVLMTNHVHLLITPYAPMGVSKLMQSLGRRYVRYVNDKYGRTGTLWDGRFKASLIDSCRYLLICYRYIELNPVRAGMVEHPGAYCYSSYRHNAAGQADMLLHDHAIYTSLAETAEQRQGAYRALFDGHIDEKMMGEIRGCANACLVLGDDRFKDDVESTLQRSVRHKKNGRPMKETAV